MQQLLQYDDRLNNCIAPAFRKVHNAIQNNMYTHYWLAGGRGSTKSSYASIEIIDGIMKDSQANAVILRKVKDTLSTSVYTQLLWAIDILRVSDKWESTVSPLRLVYKLTGQEILFRGALLQDDITKIKSTKFVHGYCKYIWYEEVQEFNGMEEIRNINQSLMRGGDHFVVLYSYNPPKSVKSWVNLEANVERSDKLVHRSTYLEVPPKWLGEQFIIEAEHLKLTKPKVYEHEYLGEVTGTGGEIFDNVVLRRILGEEISTFENVRRGLDFGYAIDPLSYVVCNYDRKHKTLYIFHEVYKVGMSNYNLMLEIKKENVYNSLITADSAEPKSISELNQYGLRVSGVKKGPDSIEYGIKFLQDLEQIVIDDARCPETAREFVNYEYAKDSQGNYKDGYPDKDNHTIDAVRYAVKADSQMFWEEKKEDKKITNFDFEKPKPDQIYGGEITNSYMLF